MKHNSSEKGLDCYIVWINDPHDVLMGVNTERIAKLYDAHSWLLVEEGGFNMKNVLGRCSGGSGYGLDMPKIIRRFMTLRKETDKPRSHIDVIISRDKRMLDKIEDVLRKQEEEMNLPIEQRYCFSWKGIHTGPLGVSEEEGGLYGW